jgi:hypothetical protein
MIRKDLEEVEDVFAANVISAGFGDLGREEGKPKEEWVDSEQEEDLEVEVI